MKDAVIVLELAVFRVFAASGCVVAMAWHLLTLTRRHRRAEG
jgi:hypothetical protein